jgi:LAO/AO transport system kinase
MHLMRPKHQGLHPKVLRVSSVEGGGIIEAWDEMAAIHAALSRDGRLGRLRAEQGRRWFWGEVQTLVSETILENAVLATEAARLEHEVAEGSALPFAAARSLIRRLGPA